MKQKEQSGQPSGMVIIIGVVIVVAVLFLASRLLGGGQSTPDPTATPEQEEEIVQDNSDSDLNLGNVVVAENVDRDGCAVDVTDTFGENDAIYAVLEDSAVPEGTTVFARLYRGNDTLEDSDEITANEDFTNVCVHFVFENEEDWDSGDYEVEFFVNGNAYESAAFTVR
jgi:hypothetical protein